jgi:large subunit ribosomal protein L4e
MELKIIDLTNAEKGSIKLPSQFDEEYRPDLIKRAVLVIQKNKKQPYGADPEAGKRASAYVSKRRNTYRGTYGIGQSRTPRKVMSRRGERMNWTGAFAPQTVGGRRAHPPKAEKILKQKINKKEKRKAIRSAIAATVNKKIVEERGHLVPERYPFVIDSKIGDYDKTKQIKDVLKKLGFEKEIKRGSEKSIRAGRGKLRGRKYKKKKSILVVVEKDCKLIKSIKNLPGIDVIKVNELNAELLAPGTVGGRLTLWTKGAIERIEKEKLFI